MSRMAGCTTSNRAIVIGASNTVALLAPTGHRRAALEGNKRMWRAALDASGLVPLGEDNLLGLESLLAINCCPGDCRVTTSEKFLINALMATAAITGRKFGHDYEAVMFLTVLILCRLMAV